VVGAVDAGRVVYGVRVDLAPVQGVLHAPSLGEAEVPALADHAAPELCRVDPHGVVGPVADVGVGLARRLHVGPDAAVPEQVHLGREEGPDHLLGRERVFFYIEKLLHLRRERDGLGGPREDTAALGDEVLVVIRPRGARQVEEPLALLEAGLGVGVGVEEDVEVVERADELDVPGQ
jgi:hypothetical protein